MPERFPEPSGQNGFLIDHVNLLSTSLQRWTGCGLMEDETDPLIGARQLYFAPFVLLSHGIEDDPVINYANCTAQELFEMEWAEITRLPSRLSAEPVVQAERYALLQRVTEQGFIDDYCGVRISTTGRRFLIDHATVWNLENEKGVYCGQAAMFAVWQML